MTRKHTEETKKKLSEKRKKWLAENPDKHVWKRHEKLKSVPCEAFKEILRKENILFEEEHEPLFPERFFAVDISFPKYKVAIEINGNQHYDSDKNLKPYYAERKVLLDAAGWRTIDVPYLIVFQKDKTQLNALLDLIRSEFLMSEEDVKEFLKIDEEKRAKHQKEIELRQIQRKKDKQNLKQHFQNIGLEILENRLIWQPGEEPNKENVKHDRIAEKTVKINLCSCGKEKLLTSNFCKICAPLSGANRKFDISKDELQKLVDEKPLQTIGKIFGVSDNAIRKRCIKLKIDLSHRFKTQLQISDDDLKKLLQENNYSAKKVAKILDADSKTISAKRKEFNLPLTSLRKIKLSKEELIKLRDTKTLQEIADELSVNVSTVVRAINK